MSRKTIVSLTENPRTLQALDALLRAIDAETKAGRLDADTIAILVGAKPGVAVYTSGCDCDGCLARLRDALTKRINGEFGETIRTREVQALQ